MPEDTHKKLTDDDDELGDNNTCCDCFLLCWVALLCGMDIS
jgi:hypothetical protein